MLRRVTYLSRLVPLFGRIQNYSSFTVRDILYETSDESGTLLARFAKHIALECRKDAALMPTKIRYADYFPVTDIRYFKSELNRTPTDQLGALITFAFTYRPSADPAKFANVLNELDAQAAANVKQMNCDTLLNTLYAFLYLMPNWIMRTNFYRVAMKQLVNDELIRNMTREKFVQICFFLGLAKKSEDTTKLITKLFDKHLATFLPKLSQMDLAVVCSAAYKTGTLVKNKSYDEHIAKAILVSTGKIDDALLITFLKGMRLQRIRSDYTCESVDKLCLDEKFVEKLQLPGLVHILAYLAESLWDKKETCKPLMMEFVKRLGAESQNQFRTRQAANVRIKDLGVFLWACSQLDVPPPDGVLYSIEQFLSYKVRSTEFRSFPDQLVDCCLSLWILGQKSVKLVDEAMIVKSKVTEESQKGSKSKQPKIDSRLTVLLSAAAIENPKWAAKKHDLPLGFNKLNAAPPYLLKDRVDLTSLAEQVSLLNGVDRVQFTCPIHGINIPSLQLTVGDNLVFVELLTPNQVLKFSRKPTALIRLKIRLLMSFGYKVVVLNPDSIERNMPILTRIIFPMGMAETHMEANVNDSAVEVNVNDSAVDANVNDSAVDANVNDSKVEENVNDSKVEENVNDSTVKPNVNDSKVGRQVPIIDVPFDTEHMFVDDKEIAAALPKFTFELEDKPAKKVK